MEQNDSYEKRLVRKIRHGDEKAFQEAFYQYKDRLFSYCYRFTKSEDLAEEIVHDALLKVWTNRKFLDENRSFISYLYTITRNLALNFLKKSATDEVLKRNVQAYFATWHNETEDAVHYANLEEIANLAISQLPPQQQRIYRMSRDEKMTHEEIAESLNISKHTVRNHIIKSLQSIKQYLQLHADISLFILYSLSIHFSSF